MTERGFSSESSFRQTEATRSYYRELQTYLEFELSRSPELQEDLRHLLNYAYALQHIAPAHRPRVNNDVLRVALPHIPTTLPPDRSVIHVGDHMTISTNSYAYMFWPDQSMESLTLSDDTTVNPNVPVGSIDIVSNLPRLEQDGNVIAYARALLSSTTISLTELADLCEHGDHRLRYIKVFAGASHLARVAGRLHFTVFDIVNDVDRHHITMVSKGVAEHVGGSSKEWQKFMKTYKPARIAYISRDSLVAHFGHQARLSGHFEQ